MTHRHVLQVIEAHEARSLRLLLHAPLALTEGAQHLDSRLLRVRVRVRVRVGVRARGRGRVRVGVGVSALASSARAICSSSSRCSAFTWF